MRNHARGFLFLSLVFLAGAAAFGQDDQAEAAKVVVPNEGDTGKIQDGIKAIDGNLEGIGDIANQIFSEIGVMNADIARLRAKISELQKLNGAAADEIKLLNERVDVLVEQVKVLGDRYVKMIGIAGDYKAKYQRARGAAIILGSTTVVLGGLLIGIAAADK